MKRRGFLGALGGLVAAPFVPSPEVAPRLAVDTPAFTTGGLIGPPGSFGVDWGNGDGDERTVLMATSKEGTQVVIELDGRQFAEAILPHLPSVVRRNGLR